MSGILAHFVQMVAARSEMVTPMGVLSLSPRKKIEKTKISTWLGCFKLSMLHFLEVLYQFFRLKIQESQMTQFQRVLGVEHRNTSKNI